MINDPSSSTEIRLRGVSVNNLREVDLDLAQRQLIAFCGVSGSGKSSLAFDTLFAEGQRRYIESFSTYTRQFLQQLDKPEAESIEGIPPSISVTRNSVSRSSRATVGSATQINEHLQLLFSRIGVVVCHGCGATVDQDSPEAVTDFLSRLGEGTKLMIGFTSNCGTQRSEDVWLSDLVALGYRRGVLNESTFDLTAAGMEELHGATQLEIVLDRILASPETIERQRDSLESAFEAGRGTCIVWVQDSSKANGTETDPTSDWTKVEIDGRIWNRRTFSRFFRCDSCDIDYPTPEPQLLNFNNPLGACPECEGFGNVIDIDMSRVVPDDSKSIREGAIAPWNTPAYEHELQELLALAEDYNLPVDIPYKSLQAEHLRIIREGVPERDFGGVDGFF